MTDAPKNLSIGRNIKIGFFHLASGMADVLTTGVWNRIMISDLGYAATPVGLLVSMRYFLAPLSIWAGRMSDRHIIAGYRRLFWVWLGRLVMVISMLGLGFLTAALARGAASGPLAWLGLTLALLLFSLGNAISGSTFLALIYDVAPEHQRGRAVGIVWTFLLTGFAVGGAFFGLLLPSNEGGGEVLFSAGAVQTLFVVAALTMGFLWFVALLGEEKRARAGDVTSADDTPEAATSFMDDMRLALRHRQTTMFMGYLALSMMFAFSQDLILEPFAGDVFNMDAGVTTRFAAYWGTTAIIGSLLFLVLARRFKALTNTVMSQAGVIALIITFGLYAASAFLRIEALVMPGLLLLGIGLGIWNIGTLGLMMDMSPDGRAGTFLGFWTLVVTLSRGLGVSGGGILRDSVLGLSGSYTVAYGAVFAIGAVGLAASYIFLTRTRADNFGSDADAVDTAQMIGAALD